MKNKKVLIISTYKDIHAIATEMALSLKYQLDVTRWIMPTPGDKQSHSIHINNDFFEWKTNVALNVNFDTVWLRRIAFPKLNNQIFFDEKAIMEKELRIFLTSIYTNIVAPSSFWINPISSLLKENDKLNQLQLAKKVGLSIPKTLFSNEPEAIKKFIDSCSLCVYKGLSSIGWVDSVLYVSRVTQNDMPNDVFLQNMPGIYQEEVKKKYELRVMMFGYYPVAVKITLKSKETDYVEWGRFSDDELLYEQVDLPEKIINQLGRLMNELGFVFGCIDLMVTENDEYVFLEINQQGQFLWIEAANPEIYLLDPFIDFIVNGSVDFRWNLKQPKISFVKDIIENPDFQEICKQELIKHTEYYKNAS